MLGADRGRDLPADRPLADLAADLETMLKSVDARERDEIASATSASGW